MTGLNINLILDFSRLFENVAIVNSPRIAELFLEMKLRPHVLGKGEQYEQKIGYRRWALDSPTYIEESYDILIVEIDPNLDSDRQFEAMQILAKFDLENPIILVVPEGRELSIKKAFSLFGILPLTHRVEIGEEPLIVFSNWELNE